MSRAKASSKPSAKLVGRREPRLSTEPLRRLTRSTSRGFEVIDFARDVLGEPLLPWQEELVIRALELNRDGTYRFRVILSLVARQSGKTHVSRVISLWRLYVDGARLVLGVGQDVSLAREVWSACIDTIKAVPELASELDVVRRVNGDEWFRLTNGARYKIAAANRSAGRGLSVDHLNMDEIREQRSWDAWSALSKTTNARPLAQTWAISNAGDDDSVVLNHLREAALAGADPSIGIFEWSAPDGCDLDDPSAWAQANPGLGYTVSEQAIRSALGTDPPAVFRTEVLCQRVDALDSAVDLQAWQACKDPAGSLESVRDRVVACVDVAPDGQHVTLAAAAVLPDGRVRTEIVGAWSSTDDARFKLGPMLEKVNAAALAWFPSGPAAALAPTLRGVEAIEIKGAAVAEACQTFADLVASRRIVHPGDPLYDAHVAGAQKLRQGDGWRFVRRGAGHVDAAYAGAGAVHTALTLPVEKPKPRSAVF
ncbi:terminase [Micromonospora globbae]|uniref:Terminase n=1 Tax=Micromonospora globbae TaxID=1894969 RepID=A0A420EU13_9ACTN|nr:terminase [Micromonospora globbae]RKF24133.1 terminase [Micromonospora globbae]